LIVFPRFAPRRAPFSHLAWPLRDRETENGRRLLPSTLAEVSGQLLSASPGPSGWSVPSRRHCEPHGGSRVRWQGQGSISLFLDLRFSSAPVVQPPHHTWHEMPGHRALGILGSGASGGQSRRSFAISRFPLAAQPTTKIEQVPFSGHRDSCLLSSGGSICNRRIRSSAVGSKCTHWLLGVQMHCWSFRAWDDQGCLGRRGAGHPRRCTLTAYVLAAAHAGPSY
jgi:hypothetical protein